MLQRPILLYRVLRNFFVCKYYYFTKKYTYPNSILPKRRYIPKIDLNSLINKQDVIVLRRSNFPTEDTFTVTGTLREKALVSNDVIGLSLNLMGGFFLSRYIKFIPLIKTSASENWNGGCTVFLSDFFDLYRVETNCSCIFYQAKDLHNKSLPFTKSDDKEAQKFFKNIKVKYEKEADKLTVNCRSFVEHVPTNLNYWHAEIKLTDAELKPFKKNSNQLHQSVSDLMFRDILCVKGFALEPVDIKKIGRIYYKSKPNCLFTV